MKKIYYIFIASLFLGFHYSLIVYINSSFLFKFVSGNVVNILYATGAVFNICLFLLAPRIFHKIGLKTAVTVLVIAEFSVVLMLAKVNGPFSASFFFIMQQTIGSIIFYCLDLFLEASTMNENKTGRLRSFFLTSFNLPILVSLLFLPHLIQNNSFSLVYTVSAFMLMPILFIFSINFNDPIKKSTYISMRSTFRFISKNYDILRILFVNLTLQFFYAIMVIYTPLFLNRTIGFSWSEIGFIFMIMLIPFIIFEIPIGKVIDKKTGEKEFIFIGLVVMAAACVSASLLQNKIFWLWAGILFISRIGASLVEISSESYFFKHVTERHSSIISFFRMTAPLAYLIAPLVALVTLQFTSYRGIFIILGIVCAFGLFFIPKVDTR